LSTFPLTLNLNAKPSQNLTRGRQPDIQTTQFWSHLRLKDSDSGGNDNITADSVFEEQERLSYLKEARIFATRKDKADPDWKPPQKRDASSSEEGSDAEGADNIPRLLVHI
jgi:hypothetical protein